MTLADLLTMKKKVINNILFIFLIETTITINNAYAYLDPGAITAFIQLLIAGIAGALVTIKFWWLSFKNFILNIFKPKKDKHQNENK